MQTFCDKVEFQIQFGMIDEAEWIQMGSDGKQSR